jgi:hypothetical protein
MGLRCWFFEHKWIDALDESLYQCEYCDKLKRKPPPPPAPPAPPPLPPKTPHPKGTHPCPYGDCGGYITPPPERVWKNGSWQRPFSRDKDCIFCKRTVRFQRPGGQGTWNVEGWPNPIPYFEGDE